MQRCTANPTYHRLILCFNCVTRVHTAINVFKHPHCRVRICELWQTHNDPFAALIRKRLRKRGVAIGVTAVWSDEPVQKVSLKLTDGSNFKKSYYGTCSYLPALFGLNIAAHVINDAIGNAIGSGYATMRELMPSQLAAAERVSGAVVAAGQQSSGKSVSSVPATKVGENLTSKADSADSTRQDRDEAVEVHDAAGMQAPSPPVPSNATASAAPAPPSALAWADTLRGVGIGYDGEGL